MINKLMEALLLSVKDGSLVQGVVTIMLVGADIVLVFQGKIIPDILGNSTLLVLGFWFGSRSLSNKTPGG